MITLSTSVVICGAGPAGLILAHLLGHEGVPAIVIERLDSTVAEPRAIALDGEALRTLQKIGLLDGFRDELFEGVVADYVNGEGKLLFTVGRNSIRPYGYEMTSSFDQPALDRYLAQQLVEQDNGIDLLFSHTLQGFEQSDQGVRVSCLDADGAPLSIDCNYLVGCDGGRSTVRSLLGISMTGESNPQPWLVIDTKDPTLVDEMPCRFFCDPKRPGMTIRKRHGERRWEWMLMPGEDRETLLNDDTIASLISPYTDVSQVDIYRKKIYDFHALIADQWQNGRVFLAGDAAHMTPPFAGQGLNSGVRDVTNLAWKLALVVKGNANPAILDSYEKDRREHARQLIEIATNLGSQIQPIDPALAAERDAFFDAVSQDPAAMDALEQDMFSSLTDRHADPGLCVTNTVDSPATTMIVQPEVTTQAGIVLLDQVIGTGFAVIGFNCDLQDCVDSSTLAQWQNLDASVVRIDSAPGGHPAAAVDHTGALTEWLGTSSAMVMLIRPDRFCMVCAAPELAGQQLQQAYHLLGTA